MNVRFCKKDSAGEKRRPSLRVYHPQAGKFHLAGRIAQAVGAGKLLARAHAIRDANGIRTRLARIGNVSAAVAHAQDAKRAVS